MRFDDLGRRGDINDSRWRRQQRQPLEATTVVTVVVAASVGGGCDYDNWWREAADGCGQRNKEEDERMRPQLRGKLGRKRCEESSGERKYVGK